MNINNQSFLKLRQDFSQKCIAETMPLEFIKYKADKGLLKTDMDMQRQYVWIEPQEQELIDSILLNVRIPEFHALIEEDRWNVCDGKQRFTCLFNFLNNKIPYKKRYARKELEFLFPEKVKELYFKDLSKELQADILNTTITIAKYTNLTRQEQILLFRKINNGTALSSLAKGLSSYYYMRTDYTYFILNLPCFQNNDYLNKPNQQEDLECAIIRMLILIAFDKPIDLQQNILEKYYSCFENINYIVEQREKVINTIQRIPNIKNIFNNRSWKTIFPFIIYGIYLHPELNKQQIEQVLNRTIIEFKAGRGSDLSISGVKKRIAFIEEIIKSII